MYSVHKKFPIRHRAEIVSCRPTHYRRTTRLNGRRLPGTVVNPFPATPINGGSAVKRPERQLSPHRSEPVPRSSFCGPCGPMSLCSQKGLDRHEQSPGARVSPSQGPINAAPTKCSHSRWERMPVDRFIVVAKLLPLRNHRNRRSSHRRSTASPP